MYHKDTRKYDRKEPVGTKLLRWILAPLAMLPLKAVYPLSDALAFATARIFRYRVRTVRKNLRESFPDKSHKALRRIEKDFYRHFTDQIFETIKLIRISDRQMMARMKFKGMDAVCRDLAQGRQVICFFSHCGNWEWATSFKLHLPEEFKDKTEIGQVYRPLKNRSFDSLMLRLRSRFGTISYPKTTVSRRLLRNRLKGTPGVTGFMSDQKPSHNDSVRKGMFLNHTTAMIGGTELLARHLDAAVYYWDMRKTSRGRYEIDMIQLTHSASAEPEWHITDTYRDLLQATVRRQPHIWLWTHRRWKKPILLD